MPLLPWAAYQVASFEQDKDHLDILVHGVELVGLQVILASCSNHPNFYFSENLPNLLVPSELQTLGFVFEPPLDVEVDMILIDSVGVVEVMLVGLMAD